ncbi:MAG: recombination mediator RecR [Negativicoccus succinicivorans]|uniref:recombination mediator RecR n=1 Tax=Negativicoccus succinicivorans TaxID=620903 RepID=UPI0026F1CEF8|nr:recombination mediator RecR [Negativicoccus succinicivorans]MBS6028571.1 recombination mediator RecR [Negativicoccus succinicivorans]
MNEPLERLTEQFRRLPGVGVKTARRLAYFILEEPQESVDAFIEAITTAKAQTKYCSVCGNLSTQDPCEFCADPRRDHSVICVVESPTDVQAMERCHEYHGVYHVLHGALSPLDGIQPEQLHIRELLERLRDDTVQEIIMATDPDAEGEATALYIAGLVKPIGIKVTRIARGLPAGGDIGFVDGVTLAGAVAHRQNM